MNPRFLFIGGTARSGTSILTRILIEEPSICLGFERYWSLFSTRRFTPEIFEYERFFTMTPEDTWYDSLSKFEGYYQKVRNNYPTARYVGDKIPQLPRRLDYVLSNFPDVRLIITLRDIVSVARSYEARADDGGDWGTERRTAAAVEDWNKMLDSVSRHLRDPRLHFICHEDMFASRDALDAVFRFLEISPSQAVYSAFDTAQSKWRDELVHRPPRILDAQADDLVRRHARFDLYDVVRAQAQSRSTPGHIRKLGGRIKVPLGGA